ncbi:hypothetical protein MMC07_007433, partial [Pseudocyphellaria aurata]|nr:hypothetical protein [Pseudocyphellaria aurata]
PSRHRPSSPIGTLKGAEVVLLASREIVGAEAEDESAPDLVDFASEAEEQEAFINEHDEDEDEDEDEEEEEDEEQENKNEEDEDPNPKSADTTAAAPPI